MARSKAEITTLAEAHITLLDAQYRRESSLDKNTTTLVQLSGPDVKSVEAAENLDELYEAIIRDEVVFAKGSKAALTPARATLQQVSLCLGYPDEAADANGPLDEDDMELLIDAIDSIAKTNWIVTDPEDPNWEECSCHILVTWDNPKNQTYCWTTSEASHLIYAPDEDTAYRVAIANRVATGQNPEDAIRWFRKSDSISLISSIVTDQPIATLPEVPE